VYPKRGILLLLIILIIFMKHVHCRIFQTTTDEVVKIFYVWQVGNFKRRSGAAGLREELNETELE
jgi:hypothetical protein